MTFYQIRMYLEKDENLGPGLVRGLSAVSMRALHDRRRAQRELMGLE